MAPKLRLATSWPLIRGISIFCVGGDWAAPTALSPRCPASLRHVSGNKLSKRNACPGYVVNRTADVELSLINREMDRSDFLSVSSVRDRNTAEHSGADCEKQL